MAERKLTDKQQAFVREYLVDLNAAAAYRRAGYAAKNDHVASVNAAKLMANHGIAAAIAEAQANRAKRTELTQDWVIERLMIEAQDCGETGSHSARVRALELLGKHRGMFVEKIAPVTPDGLRPWTPVAADPVAADLACQLLARIAPPESPPT
ncbi:MAG: terminase small subunit [Gemmataceae bacterium]|nr:terminase small subunit [Gemmataceae bacterium]